MSIANILLLILAGVPTYWTTMLVQAIADFFKYKIINTVIVLSCWSSNDRVKFMRQLSDHGLIATISCDPTILDYVQNHHFQGILYVKQVNDSLLEKVNPVYFSNWYKWLVISDEAPSSLHATRYDADVVLIESSKRIMARATGNNEIMSTAAIKQTIYFNDVYVHPRNGASLNPWAVWTGTLEVTHERERILRRLDLKKYPLRIATPVGHYSEDTYNGTFEEYLADNTMPERDSATRCGHAASSLILESLKATEVLTPTLLWATELNNSSMMLRVASGTAEISGSILRVLPERIKRLDYVMPIWPFSVGFTYLAERASSSNMFVEPFSPGVWWTCLAIAVLLSFAQRLTAREPMEKEGAYIAVLATWLQQDASAVPEGASGRWTFIVLSVCSMLVHAYYTSAIVSALMSTGRSGPDSLKALGDSKYAIASEDYDYMRYTMFGMETNWDDLEYLKKKKMHSNFYQNIERGVELIREGNTAFHTEYNHIYPHLRTFNDEHLCKLAYVDTIPEIMTWITTTKRCQWTDVLRTAGGWLNEVGLVKRLVSRWRIRPPPCRASLLAERVKFGDVAPVLCLTAIGAIASLILLGLEIIFAKWTGSKYRNSPVSDVADVASGDENINK
uniref:Ionotropic receptor n=1 Tax=Eogystia hippophaecolus TaxID=1206364 RepID=A0A1B3P5F6_EOGHI|nr:ionotropic receptor [Eogystia hippophaecolus]